MHFSQVDCSRVQYTEFQVDGARKKMAYSNDKLPWPDANACCESRSQTLLRLHPSSTVTILQHVSKFQGTPFIWTGGYKSLDLAPTNEFKWVDNNDVSVLHNAQSWKTENCVAADLKSDYKNGLRDYACEARLNYVCGSEAPPPCEDVEWRTIRVNSTGRSYTYANAKMSFEDAKACCGSMKGYRVLSVVSVANGNGLALALEKDAETEGKVKGYGGVWVGATRLSDGKYNYFGLDGSPNFTLRGYSRFLEGERDCLMFSVGVTLSFVLTGVGCNVTRGVVCEEKVEFQNTADGMFVDVGNSYFYSTIPMTHEDANRTCTSNRMRLMGIGDVEEMGVVIQGISQFKNHTTYLTGFWTGHKQYKIPLHDLPHSLTTYYFNKPWKVRDLREMHHIVDEYGGVTNEPPRCHESFWMVIGGEVVVEQWSRNCSRVLNFVCEVVGDRDVGVSGEELIGGNSDMEVAGVWVEYGECGGGFDNAVGRDVWVSGGEATWYQARECCSRLTPDHEFELVSMDPLSMKARLNDHVLADIRLYERISGLGFWTSGSSVAGTFGWFGSSYSFVRDEVFYKQEVGEQHVCLQAFYSTVDGGLRVVGKGCGDKSQYVCARKFDRSLNYPPCNKVLYERIGESSYFLSWDRMPWLVAADCCTQRSSILAKITRKEESSYVAHSLSSLLNSHNTSNTDVIEHGAWIGLTKPTGITNFSWVDGTTFNLASYRHTHGVDTGNHPGHDGTGDKCVGVFTSTDHKGGLVWKVLGCHEVLWSICHADGDANGVD